MSGAIKVGFCIETANLCTHSKWVWLGVSEMIESNELTVSQKMNIGMNLICVHVITICINIILLLNVCVVRHIGACPK